MILESTSTVPMTDGKYFGKITGGLVDAHVKVTEGVYYSVSFPVNDKVNGKDIPVVIMVKNSYANVHVEE